MLFTILEIIGIVAFSMSASLTAMSKKLDPFGVFVIAFVTSLGGGTMRDVMIGITPVTWMHHINYVYAIIIGYIFAIVFRKRLDLFRVSLFLFDTIGLGIYTLIGLEKGLSAELHPIVCVALGTITACFGGVLRDLLCAEIPVIFRQEVYATICILGGVFFFILKKFNIENNTISLSTAAVIITFRLLAVKYKWQIPPIKINS